MCVCVCVCVCARARARVRAGTHMLAFYINSRKCGEVSKESLSAQPRVGGGGCGPAETDENPRTIRGNVGNPTRPKKTGGRKAVCGAWGVGLPGVQEKELRTCDRL